jgi:hypothetical protein
MIALIKTLMIALIKTLMVVLFLLVFGIVLELLFGIKFTQDKLCLVIAMVALMKAYDALEAGK